MSSSDSGIESENGQDGAPAAGRGEQRQPQRELDGDLNMQPADPQPQEVEKTLTDHLNKRLLESFLNRLDSGSMDLPPGARRPPNEREENWEDS